MAALTDWMTSWGSLYANHAAIRTIVVFVHLGALVGGGGLAVATDRSLLSAGLDDGGRRPVLETLQGTHKLVIASLALIVISGALLFASDFETFLYSRFFWIKMGLVVVLMLNGSILWRAEKRVMRGDPAAWRTLRVSAAVSIVLWFLTTLGGVVLPNIG